jgi:hypothetical protein
MRDWNHDGKIDSRDFYLQDVAMGWDHESTSTRRSGSWTSSRSTYQPHTAPKPVMGSEIRWNPFKPEKRSDFQSCKMYCIEHKNGPATEELRQKLHEMMAYQVITDPGISWHDLDCDMEKGLQAAGRQLKNARNYAELIADILLQIQDLPERESCPMEQEIYADTMIQIFNLCVDGVTMLYDVGGFIRYFEDDSHVIPPDKRTAENYAETLKKCDGAYDTVALTRLEAGVEMKKALDTYVILDHEEYRRQLMKICKASEESILTLRYRHMKVALYPQYEQIETTWKQYTSFLEGLTWKERRELNKSAWTEVLSGDVFHTQTDIDKLNQLQHTTDDRVQKLNDNYKIWKMKPRRERKIVDCELQLSKLKAERTGREIKSDLEAVDNLQTQIEELKHTIQEKNDKADRLNRRLFFKRMAEKKAARLRDEAANGEEKIAELIHESVKLQDQLQEKNNLRNALEDSIKELSKKLA